LGLYFRASIGRKQKQSVFREDKSAVARDRTARSPALYLMSALTKTYIACSQRLVVIVQ
jgi:hypothetical protein